MSRRRRCPVQQRSSQSIRSWSTLWYGVLCCAVVYCDEMCCGQDCGCVWSQSLACWLARLPARSMCLTFVRCCNEIVWDFCSTMFSLVVPISRLLSSHQTSLSCHVVPYRGCSFVIVILVVVVVVVIVILVVLWYRRAFTTTGTIW